MRKKSHVTQRMLRQIGVCRGSNDEVGSTKFRSQAGRSPRNFEPGGRQLVAQGAAASAAESWVG